MRLYFLLVAASLFVASTGSGQPKFRASDIQAPGRMFVCDLDGDGLQDLVLLESNRVSIFYQATNCSFSAGPNQEFSLGEKSGLLWAARLGRKAESLLLATSEGVTEFCFTNRTAPPAERQIVQQQTFIPKVIGEGSPPVVHFPLSAGTKSGWPLLLLPVEGGLQVWQYREEWQPVQTLPDTFRKWFLPIFSNPGYVRSIGLDLSLGDLNGDGRDDLLVQRIEASGMQTYLLFLQKTNGLFALEPAMTHTERTDRNSWLCWVDLNRDGKVDLIKSTSTGDLWFFPGAQAGKVLVGVYMADAQGRLPATPQQVFRKNDAMSLVPVVDIDGDGYADLALGSAPFDSREDLRRMVTTRQLVLTLKFHFYRPGAGYRAEPDCQTEVVFQLDRHQFYLGQPPRELFEQAVTLTGDFDGDGKRDLLIRDRSDHISVRPFISREKGFSREAKLHLDCGEPIESLDIRDLNGDGVSDLIVKKQKPNSYRVFTSYR